MTSKKKLSSSTVLLILSGLVAVLLIVLSIMQIKNINQTTKKINEAVVKLEENTSRLKELSSLKDIKPEMEKALNILMKAIPQKPDQSEIMSQISNLSSLCGSDFTSIEFGSFITGSNITEIPVTMYFNGDYTSLTDLLMQWTKGERYIRIDEIQFTKRESGLKDIDAKIKAAAFYK